MIDAPPGDPRPPLDATRPRTSLTRRRAKHSTQPHVNAGPECLFLENLTSSVWSSMTECGVAVAVVERLLLSLEPGKLALKIRDQHVGQIMAETPPDHES